MKPIKRGYKIWVRADTHGFVCDFQVYTRKLSDTREFGLGERVVIDLTTGLEGKNYHIYCDNFFSSVNLMEKMKNNKLYCCGAVRANRKGLLPKLKAEKELRRGDSDYAVSSDGIHCVCWKDKRCVQLLSTIHKG